MHSNQFINQILQWGDLGVFVGMFLESSIIPIPSEVVILTAGSIGIPLASIVTFGSVGATLGSFVGYAIGRFAAEPVILRYGKYIFIKPHHIKSAEDFAKKYGIWSVLLGRLLPVIPFKVFSIAAGITRLPFLAFAICTLIGVIPRIILLSLLGANLVKYTLPTLIVLAVMAGLVLVYKLYKKRARATR